jgi:hypothetical protein
MSGCALPDKQAINTDKTIYLPTNHSALQPWVSLGLLYKQFPLLSIAHHHHHHDKMETPLGGILISSVLNKIRSRHMR